MQVHSCQIFTDYTARQFAPLECRVWSAHWTGHWCICTVCPCHLTSHCGCCRHHSSWSWCHHSRLNFFPNWQGCHKHCMCWYSMRVVLGGMHGQDGRLCHIDGRPCASRKDWLVRPMCDDNCLVIQAIGLASNFQILNHFFLLPSMRYHQDSFSMS